MSESQFKRNEICAVEQKMGFVHLPKAAGTSLNKAISQSIGQTHQHFHGPEMDELLMRNPAAVKDLNLRGLIPAIQAEKVNITSTRLELTAGGSKEEVIALLGQVTTIDRQLYNWAAKRYAKTVRKPCSDINLLADRMENHYGYRFTD